MIILADNDIIQKLARSDLLNSLPDLFQVSFEDIFIAPAARFQLLPNKPEKAIAKCGNQETVSRIRAFLAVVKDTPEVADLDLLVRLSAVPRIDPGEQLLYASCIAQKDSLLLTGDRTALNALSSAIEVADVSKALAKRVVTFESALLLAARLYGFNVVKEKLLAYPGYQNEGVLRLIVRSDMAEADFNECLVSYSSSVAEFLAQANYLPTTRFSEAA